jgi:phosphoadenosine phosphosulfate reductase
MAAHPTRIDEPAAPSPGQDRGLDELVTAAAELEVAGAETIVAWALQRYERVAVVASLQAESIVLIEMASRIRPGVDVITLDTGRLPQETHDIIEVVQRRFPITLRVVAPKPREIETMVADHGPNLFYLSTDWRHLCCEMRKTRPLGRALLGYEAWVTGLRRTQAASRTTVSVVARDDAHGGIVKVAPLAAWERDDVWAYVRQRCLPTHPLYGRGYTSIGCAPCTRAPRPGEDERAGRWWWEGGSIKECGLHPPTPPPFGDGSATDPASPSEAGAGA